MGQPVVHWEIASKDAMRLQSSLSQLFGWQINADNQWHYGIVETGGEGGINGGVFQANDETPAYITFYVAVDDLPAYLSKAEALGGQTVMPPQAIEGVGSVAMLRTPDGHVIGLFNGQG